MDRTIPSSVWTAYRGQVREVCNLAKAVKLHGPDQSLEAELMGAIDGLRRLDALVAGFGASAQKRRRK